MKTKSIFLLATAIAFLFPGCKKEIETGDMVLKFTHHVDDVSLLWDSTAYTTPAGYDYSVSNLLYYVSNIQVYGEDGVLYSDENAHLIDPSDPTTLSITLPDIEMEHVTSIQFLVGLDANTNVTGALPNNTANNNMAWPEMMGGGYHFMKFEGYYFDSLGGQHGFAMHVGKTGNDSQCSRTFDAHFETDGQEFELPMNLNEWFRNPHIYDFEVDGSGSMYDDAAMQKLAENGDDVFSN